MSSNVGLSTPRGSGTSGYVQRNLSQLKPRNNTAPYPKDYDTMRHKQRQPDKEILEHDRKREIEVKIFELRDRLEDEGYVLKIAAQTSWLLIPDSVDEDEIDDQVAALRKKLEVEQKGKGTKVNARGLKSHQVHELAEAKIEETEKLRKALGISKNYEEGSHWKRQEERLRTAVEPKSKGDD